MDRNRSGLRSRTRPSRQHLAAESAAIGMAIVRPDGRYEYVNPALCRLLGRDAHTLRGMTWRQVTHPGDLEKDQQQFADLLAGRIDRYRLTKRYLRPDGSVVWGDLAVTMSRTPHARRNIIVAQVLDVTENVALGERLRESESRTRLIAENVSDVVYVSGLDFRVSWISPSVTRNLGWTPDELVGKRMTDLIHPDDLLTAAADLDELVRRPPQVAGDRR